MRLRELRPGFMLDHLFTRRNVAPYLDGDLDDAGRRRIEEHAHRCPRCRRIVATLMATLEGLRALGHRRDPGESALAAAVIARLRDSSG